MPKAVASTIEGSLRRRIAAGEWSSTGRLPAERDLAVQYGVARNTVRRAVEAIAHDGMIERHVGRGTFVNGEASELADIVQRVTGVSPADLIAVRLIIEPQAAALAARNASSADLLAIADAHHRGAEAHHNSEFEHWDFSVPFADICRHAKPASGQHARYLAGHPISCIRLSIIGAWTR